MAGIAKELNLSDEEIWAFLNSSFGAAFNTQFSPQLTGRNAYNPFGTWLGNQQSNYFNQYQGKVAGNPNLSFLDFLQGMNPQQEYRSLAPSQRGGPRESQFAPPVRWINDYGAQRR